MTLLDGLTLDIAIMGNHDEEVLDPAIFQSGLPEWVALNNWIIDQLEPGTQTSSNSFRAMASSMNLTA